MIEINLVPGSTRRAARRKAKVSLPAMPKFLQALPLNRWMALAVAGPVLSLALIAWLFTSTRGRTGELQAQIDQAVQDSARYAGLIAANEKLMAKRDTIAQKLQVIQEVDAGRYVLSHILDEFSRALPQYTWLQDIAQIDSVPTFRVEGQTGSMFALTEFMKNLEASPFLRGVDLVSTLLVKAEEGGKPVHQFVLQAAYEEPPPGLVETVPLFAAEKEQ
ncbi:MAG: PilN domain-containing protein [Gemmatimonadetes bacterium]|nr:PilN domain-containing protein [Gemmatimonadota bacterium]